MNYMIEASILASEDILQYVFLFSNNGRIPSETVRYTSVI